MKQIALMSILSIGMLLVGCEENNVKNLNGQYSGIFIYTHPASSVAPPPTGNVTVNLEGNRYSSTGNSNHIPAGGSGIFEIINSDRLKFTDENVWTTNFDWGLVLSGEYKYHIKGDSLFLSKYFEGYKAYEYRLKKVQ